MPIIQDPLLKSRGHSTVKTSALRLFGWLNRSSRDVLDLSERYSQLELRGRRVHVGDKLPCDKLPYDILFIIFTLCWEDQEEGLGSKRPHFPTTASHVCRTWRRCALETPTFWAVLEFCQRLPAFEKYQTWLERSKDHPLDILLGPEPFKGEARATHAETILQLTGPHIRRWRSISAEGLPETVVRVIFDWIGRDNGLKRLEMLETVKVVAQEGVGSKSYRGDPSWEFKPFSEGEAPPKLRHVILESESFEYFGGEFKIFQAWQILHLSMRFQGSPSALFHQFLSSFPNLNVLRIAHYSYVRWPCDDSYIRDIETSPVPPLTHHSLTELSLYVFHSQRDKTVSSLILPNLRYLLDQTRMEPGLAIFCLPHLSQNHPFPRLVSLRLGGMRSVSEEDSHANAAHLAHLEGALAGLPGLKTLTFDNVDFGGGDGQYLDCIGRVCPRLRCLILVMCRGYTLSGLVRIAEQRRGAEELDSLVRIVVQLWRLQGGGDELARLKRLVDFEVIDSKTGGTYANEAIQREWVKSIGL
ncbi:hypothetical protein FRC04_004828 [Tulasnella sp. 424]|nr:hypothetical protein FRC04_004828 [Tulasnella sp. 424]KAG8963738.1 hypothetical protein FRC05_004531 [Tulasnella sp. 425]